MEPWLLYTVGLSFSYCSSISINAEFILGLGNSSAVGPSMVGQLAEAFLDTMYKA